VFLLRQELKMRVWIFFLFCLAGKTLAAPVSKSEREILVNKSIIYMWPWITKPVTSSMGIFVAIANNTL